MANKKKEEKGKVVKFEKKVNFDGVLTKIQIPIKDEIPKIVYNKTVSKGTKNITFDGNGRALKEFIEALQNLSDYFLEVVEITGKEDETIITGVSFSDTGIVITGQISLVNNGINSPLIVNTPHLVFEAVGGGYEIPEHAKELIKELKKQAVLYMSGEAAEVQTDLFEGNANGK